MGTIMEFNRHAAYGKASAEKYCKEWSMDLEKRSKELSDQLRVNRIDTKTYNQRRLAMNNETKDLNSCVQKINTLK